MFVYPTSKFKKSFKKLPNSIKDKAEAKDKLFKENPFFANLETHKLKGKLKDYWSYSVDGNYRVLFRFISEQNAIYFNIGTHSIYK